MFNGLMICGECGMPMLFYRYKAREEINDFCCRTHKKSAGYDQQLCTHNAIRVSVIYEIARDVIRTVSRYAITNEDGFRRWLEMEAKLAQTGNLKHLAKQLRSREKRVAELEHLLKKLYEDYALDRIPEIRYDALSAEYEAELSRTEEAIAAEKQRLEQILATQDNAERFLELARRFRDCAEFADEQLSLFTDRVIVHETVKDGDGERSRRIEILLSFIGAFHIPDEPVELTPEEMKREETLKKRRIHERRKRKEKRLAREADKQMT